MLDYKRERERERVSLYDTDNSYRGDTRDFFPKEIHKLTKTIREKNGRKRKIERILTLNLKAYNSRKIRGILIAASIVCKLLTMLGSNIRGIFHGLSYV